MKPLITIVIIHWNTPEILKKQLETLSTYENVQIIVVDNNSDDSVTWVKEHFESVQLIQNKLNRGFAFACNQGVKKAQADWILFLNPDVNIDEKNLLKMIAEAEESRLDACSPIPQSKDYQKPLPTAYTLAVEFSPLRKLITLQDQKHTTLFGGCLLVRTDVIRRIGGWDERFFVWFEDSDLTRRLIQKNYRVGWINVKIKHTGGVSFKRLDDQMKKDIFFHSMNVYAQKHFSYLGKKVIEIISRRFTKKKTLPIFHTGFSLTIPNMKVDILDLFFEENKKILTDIDELIIVSSALHYKNIWELRDSFHNIRFIMLESNKGFASTVNIGLRVSTGMWIGTMNDDVILNTNWWQKCLKCASKHTGSINPVIKSPDDIIESVGIDIDLKGKAYPRTEIEENQCITVDATNAAAVLYSHAALEKVGLFDEKFGSYLEDIDLSLRLERNGYENHVATNTHVLHKKHATSADSLRKIKAWYDTRNWIYLIAKNWGIKNIVVNLPQIFIERLRNIAGIIKSMH